ncbi:DHA2 family efflux MFS transporter permease subunit [Zhihengliuella sp.]|uniref:DHA2 family efflux MFS transporter permease subunit n=1 Tax=Zhihengliuella sp. TaxID=1954483 RepID=UPI0028122D34|nr:DHA2 family efflux MFS transporter permease subunit [Zhihengliuella sp.]
MNPAAPDAAITQEDRAAWRALWALAIGFFMILVDSTIVTTAMPAIMSGLGAGVSGVVWVHSSYLLALVVPMLITGRLGDRYGPKNLYLAGLAVFTLASLACGLAGDLTTLVVARVAQGLGASLMTPQSMTFITRLFPARRRGAAMGVWGAIAGIASLAGPLLGGVLTDSLGWEWIFFVNVPIGVVTYWRVVVAVPTLETHARTVDWLGVGLSAVGILLLVFGLQEAESYDWGPVVGWIGIWHLITAGAVIMVVFVLWQSVQRRWWPWLDPLVPLGLFRDRNFTLATAAVTCMGLVIYCLNIPIMFYLQSVRGTTPTVAALLIAPMAVVGALLARYAGSLVNRRDPRIQAALGFFCFGGSIIGYGLVLPLGVPLLWLLLPAALMGAGSAFVWPAISLTATRDLDHSNAGAGSGIYNTSRQLGGVVGSALVALLMEARISASVADQAAASAPGDGTAAAARGVGDPGELLAGAIPPELADAVATGLGQSLLLPGCAALLGGVLALGFRHVRDDERAEERVLDSPS